MGLFDGVTDLVGGKIPDFDVNRYIKVVELIWENRDWLVRLPKMLGDAGEQMYVAGTGAADAAVLLNGDLQELTTTAADTIDITQTQLATVAGVLNDVGRAIGKIPLAGSVAEPVTRGLDAVGQVAENLETVAAQVRGIGDSMDGVGDGLEIMGGSLKSSGVALATVSGRDLAATKKTAAKKKEAKKASREESKKTAAKKTAAKKPAAKKAPARKPPAKKAKGK